MILTLKEDFDRELGTSLPMISRAGKSTIPQHLCFNNAVGNKKEFQFSKKEEDDNNKEINLLIGDKKAQHLNKEMDKIDVTEKQLGKDMMYSKYTSQVQARNKKSKSGQFVPFDLLATNPTHRRTISSSFNATSRDAWQSAHASKTNPPEVGKYKPKTESVWPDQRIYRIMETPPNEGKERKLRKGLQQVNCCERLFMNMDPEKAVRSHCKKKGDRSKSQLGDTIDDMSEAGQPLNLGIAPGQNAASQ